MSTEVLTLKNSHFVDMRRHFKNSKDVSTLVLTWYSIDNFFVYIIVEIRNSYANACTIHFIESWWELRFADQFSFN